jgi:hypothetical protein
LEAGNMAAMERIDLRFPAVPLAAMDWAQPASGIRGDAVRDEV